MTILLYVLAGIVLLIILLALIAPKKYEVSRSITINRPAHEVYDYLKFIKNQDEWSPWKKRDPNMKQSFEGEDGTVGFISKWDSDHKQVGSGEQEITKLTPHSRVDSELRFLKPWKSQSDAYMITQAEGDNTKVIWGFKGVNKPPMNIFMLFFNMDKAVGKDFNEGLSKLKSVLEN